MSSPKSVRNISVEDQIAKRKSGRAVFDESGRGIWEWQTATGVFEKQISHEQLSKLEAPQLSLMEERSHVSDSYGSYYEWQPRSSTRPASSPPQAEVQPTGAFKRFFARIAGKP